MTEEGRSGTAKADGVPESAAVGMPLPKSVSVVMPALNESGNIERAIETVARSVKKAFDDYEIIVVDDGSSDDTPALVKRCQEEDEKIRLVSHPQCRGFGASFDTGRKLASMSYCVMIQGDGPFEEGTLEEFFSHSGAADVICGYWKNASERETLRRVISLLYTKLLNFLLGYRLRYYNGLQLHRTDWLRDLKVESGGFGFQAEVLVRALSQGKSFREVATRYIERPGGGATKIFRLKNVVSVIRTVALLRGIDKGERKSAKAVGV